MGTPAVSTQQFSTFGDLLKYLRRRAELTQRELALQVGYSDTQISRIEQNQRVPDSATLMALFVPALHLEREAEWTARLLELAKQARLGEPPKRLEAAGSIRSNHNLPVQLTRFIGREQDIAGVKQWLTEYRLVTLTGPGGCGKTRLALKIAGALISDYEHGVWLVELAPLSDPALIAQAVAAAVGVRENPGVELSQTVMDYLSSRQTLLIVDNCEHLITAVAHFVELLIRKCPRLTVLTTSREGLGIPGEAIWTVPALSLPIPQPWTDPVSAQEMVNTYLKSESVQLFMGCVSAVAPEFTLTIDNGGWVAEICRRLDGMPLAIELAAARVRALSVKQIAERLDDRFNLLTAGSRTAPLRQQTLAAVLDWSYALLSEPERIVLQRFSVFAGGASLEAAEAVCRCQPVQSGDVLDVLSHLVEKSLVVADSSFSETRYRQLETIRQYARQKLVELGQEDGCRDRHLEYFAQWAETTAQILEGKDQLVGLKGFETEHDNLRAALEWSKKKENNAKSGLRLAAACGPFWVSHGYFSEGRRHLSEALLPEQVQDRGRTHALALLNSAYLAYLQADYPAGQLLIDEALAIWRELGPGNQADLATSLALYGGFRMEVGDYENAQQLFQEALEIYIQLNLKNRIGAVYKDLGWSAMRTGDFPQAQIHLEKSLALTQETGDKTNLNFAYSGLGEVAVRLGQYDRASALLEKGLSLSRELGDKWLEATILGSLGWTAVRTRNFDAMRNYLSDSLSFRIQLGDQGGIAWCLEKLGEAAVLEQEDRKAVTLFAFAASLRIPIHSVIDPVDQPEYERNLAGLRSKLGQKVFDACWEEGEGMRLNDVVAYALSEPAAPIAEPSVSDKEKFQGLSKRERETAALVAQGKSNREIAQIMTVGEKTVETYVGRILDKLGFDSRVQIATWAVERGLVSAPKQ